MMEENREKIKLSLLTEFANATGIYRRTIPKDKKKTYKDNLKKLIKKLIKKVNNNSIKNKYIRKSIKNLSKNAKISTGASQKVINVYLKYYCILANKSNSIIKELDCPIDSFVIKENKLKRVSLIRLSLKDYEEMQDTLGKKYGVRLLADVRAWDDKKIY